MDQIPKQPVAASQAARSGAAAAAPSRAGGVAGAASACRGAGGSRRRPSIGRGLVMAGARTGVLRPPDETPAELPRLFAAPRDSGALQRIAPVTDPGRIALARVTGVPVDHVRGLRGAARESRTPTPFRGQRQGWPRAAAHRGWRVPSCRAGHPATRRCRRRRGRCRPARRQVQEDAGDVLLRGRRRTRGRGHLGQAGVEGLRRPA